ncbi:MAG TPA: hypothetical protein VEX41_07870 [Candidatus Eisenbacteria bacterium]|nr:hypothetical protein [Candidatus Eisenbacteria bacterium]
MGAANEGRTATIEERQAWLGFLRWMLYARTYEAADRAGISDPIARVAFVRRRLEPGVPNEVIEGILANLARRFAEGETWVYDRPTIADIVGERLGRQIAEFGLLPSSFGQEQLEPRSTSRLRA